MTLLNVDINNADHDCDGVPMSIVDQQIKEEAELVKQMHNYIEKCIITELWRIEN